MERYVKEHPLREQLLLEVHARPFEPMTAPERGSHIAILTGELAETEAAEHLAELCQLMDAPPPTPDVKHYSQDMGPFRLRWEQHTEFCTYTFIQAGAFDHPFENPVIGMVPKDWLVTLPGEALGAMHFAMEAQDAAERDGDNLAQLFKGDLIVGALVSGGDGQVWSDLRMHDDRFSRVLIRDRGMSQNQAGRLVQRIAEVNAYRLLALLALPLARDLSPRIREVDAALARITQTLADTNPDASEDSGERALLEELSGLASEVEKIGGLTSYRFSAAEAYRDIVRRRLGELRQERIKGLQTFSEFLDRRLAPAMNSVRSTAERIESLSERMSRVGSLIRARVEVQIEEQNRDLLASMDRRAQMQFRLQRIVEGLSVVAITYYMASMVKFILTAMAEVDVPVNATLGTGISVPIIGGLIWWAMRRAQKALGHED
ncbi:MAG: DUF3422 domain-containing protein [Alphaproteobacteria bacterium]|jgi:uncharacterized membrane-anchored protein|nr:DUF3422 domain-containing protein [Alphaproteobacteria bacterium]MBT4711023.1 DUF3422 domain-containing protein [Alphaproteobacteria bacterium]